VTSTDDILTQIDSALTDATIGPDAMRSQPGAGRESALARLGTVPVVQMRDETGEWQELGGVTSIDIQLAPPVVDPEFAPAWQDMQEYIARIQAERIQLVTSAFEAMRRAFQQLAPAVQQAVSQTREALQNLPEAAGCDDCGKPARPRDRPAWQSPYGPPQRRR
jgi:hypothetical protein